MLVFNDLREVGFYTFHYDFGDVFALMKEMNESISK